MKTFKTFDINSAYTELHKHFPNYKKSPIIGISANFQDNCLTLTEGYFSSILEAGGTPILLPAFSLENDNSINAIFSFLNQIDGLILSGGADINPLYMGEEPIPGLQHINYRRDQQELLLVRLAANRQIPILGICRGMQVMNVALGGNLYQDLTSQKEGDLLKHSQDLDKGISSHSVMITEGSILHQLFNTTHLHVNSFHHQAVKSVAPTMRVTATAHDGVIEAIESNEYKSILGIQWHPECYLPAGDSSMMPIFQWLVAEASSYARAKEIHKKHLILDTHCDTPMFFHKQIQFDHRDPRIKVDLHKMTEGRQDATIMVAYLAQHERTQEGLQQATVKANKILDDIELMVANNADSVGIAYTPDELYKLKSAGKKAIMLGIENGYAIGKDITNIEHFRRRGVVYMTLCHNGNNDICGSCKHNSEDLGISEFGGKVIAEMDRTGMMIDLSHAGVRTIDDAIGLSRNPVVCSHSSVYALCNHPRNVIDRQIKAIAAKGGVIQVCIYDDFLRSDRTSHILDIIDHINYIVNTAGIDHVGIGTDFDGDGGVIGCNDSSELIQITRRLLAAKYSETDIQKIWGENFLRVMREVQTNAKL